MTAWVLTIDLPLYLPEAVDRVLEARDDLVDRIVFAPPPTGLALYQQYRMFGPIDGLRMGRLYAQGALLGLLAPRWQRRLTGRLHSVSDAARVHGIPAETVSDINDPTFVERVREADPELLLSLVCAQRLGSDLLEVPDWAINLHPSLLPGYRGTSPEFWALYHDEEETGWTAHVMIEEFDAGPIIDTRTVPIRTKDTLHSLTERLGEAGAEFAIDLLDELPGATFETRPNPTTADDYFPMPSPDDRREFKRRGNRFL